MPERIQPGLLEELERIRERHGGISPSDRTNLAKKLKLPLAQVEGVASSYPLFAEPYAKHNIRLCKSLSCNMEESHAISRAVRRELKISKDGESRDGQWSFAKVNCLGLCGDGPAMLINGKEYTSLTPAKALAAIRKLKRGK